MWTNYLFDEICLPLVKMMNNFVRFDVTFFFPLFLKSVITSNGVLTPKFEYIEKLREKR